MIYFKEEYEEENKMLDSIISTAKLMQYAIIDYKINDIYLQKKFPLVRNSK